MKYWYYWKHRLRGHRVVIVRGDRLGVADIHCRTCQTGRFYL